MLVNKNSFFKDALEVIVCSGITVFILLNFVIFPCRVDGSSMYPTLKTDQRGYSFIFTKIIGINRFDICVLDVDDNGTSKKIVKRVIGLPNETIEYKDNKLFIDGEYYSEAFLSDVFTEDFKVTLKEDEYYCLGDNRNVSKDSRYYGAFNKNAFKATHVLVISPLKEFGFRK